MNKLLTTTVCGTFFVLSSTSVLALTPEERAEIHDMIQSAEYRETLRAVALEARTAGQYDVPIGSVLPFAGNSTIPAGYLECDGRELPKPSGQGDGGPSDYSLLWAVIGTTFTPENEHNGATFRIPDFRGRTPLGAGQGFDLVAGQNNEPPKRIELTNRCIGDTCGKETHTLTVAEIPAHSHKVRDTGHSHPNTVYGHQGGSPGLNAGGIYVNAVAAGGTGSASANIHEEVVGSDSPHNIMQPSLTVRFIIRAQGEVHGRGLRRRHSGTPNLDGPRHPSSTSVDQENDDKKSNGKK